MKTFIISLVVLGVLLIGINIYSFYLEDAVGEIEKCFVDISDMVYEKEWEKCIKKTEKLLDVWRKNEPILAMFNDHEDVDNIKLSIGELKESVLHKNYEETFKTLAEAKILLERIRKNETLSLENILGLAHFSTRCHNML